MTPEGRSVTALEAAERLRDEKQVLAVAHEGPDGDALGCLSAFVLMCESLGIPCSSYVPGEGAFPDEYTFLPRLAETKRGAVPEVSEGTTVYFLDCASLLRGASDGFPSGVTRVNVDHHHDNPGYGDLNLVDAEAASTTEILYEIFEAGGFAMDSEVATALYVGLVTDTGRFQYSNTTPKAHRVAAKLQEAGCDINAVNREVYEKVPLAKVLLTERMLSRLEVRLGGALVTSWLTGDDFAETGAHEGHSEGLIDTLRCITGVSVAVLAREKQGEHGKQTKISLRSTDGALDVAELAHERGGGGHVRAAGFTTEGEVGPVLTWIEDRIAERL